MLVGGLLAVREIRLCRRWCLCAFYDVLWRKLNDKSFEDREKTMEEITSLFFKTLYLWTSAYVSSLSIIYSDFLVLFALFFDK
jgi:hypothetical protein